MENKRILYIDLLKGLSITWVVWFHTVHPEFVDYGFLMPLFFLASAIFFKPYPIKKFIEKKLYQLIIPFVLFYLLYYIFLIGSSFLSTGSLSDFDYICIFDIFKPYSGNGGPTVNPPLWFIMALLDLQVLLYVCTKLIKWKWTILSISLVLSICASLFWFEDYTYFQFGRALRYFCYYAFGYLFGKDIINIIEAGGKQSKFLFIYCILILCLAIVLKSIFETRTASILIDYFRITSLVIILIYFFKYGQDWIIMRPLKYYGANSYIILGINEMILTTILVFYTHFIGPLNIWTGLIHWVLTMILLIPVIGFMKKHLSYLVGKRNIFEQWRFNRQQVSINI